MTNNSDKINKRGVFVSVAYFWVNSTGFSGAFHVVFLISNILKKKLHIPCLVSLEQQSENSHD